MIRALPLLLLACGGSGGGADPGALGEVSVIEVSPAQLELVSGPAGAPPVQFTATVRFRDGNEVENFEQIEWSHSNISAGELDAEGLFTPSSTNGGRTLVKAQLAGAEASADVTVIYQATIEDGDLPAGAETAFSGTAAIDDAAVQLTYPEAGVALPRNLPLMTFMWANATGADLYRLRFESDTSQLTVLTEATHWDAPPDLWRAITATNAGGQVLVQVEAAVSTRAGDTVTGASSLVSTTPAPLVINRLDADGAIYYFGTSRGGLERVQVDEIEPTAWYGPPSGLTDNCVGCHVANPTGTRMALAYEITGSGQDRMALLEVAEDATPTPLTALDATGHAGYFSSFSPDGAHLVVASGGTLSVFDGQTGAFLHDVASEVPLSMPDWDPDGSRMLAVTARNIVEDSAFINGEIVVLEHLGDGQFGAMEVLVPRVDGTNFYYPTFSPDGDWIVFNRSSTNSYFAPDATLFIMPAQGGPAIELAAAMGSFENTSSWPRWGPIPDDDVLWLTFASDRPYGNLQPEEPQIWVVGIDTTKAAAGVDPSFPAFRMPQQELEGGNHAPWWSPL